MMTLLLITIPILSGLIVWILPRAFAFRTALVSALASLAVGVYTYTQFDAQGGVQFIIDVPWIDMLGAHFHIGMDGISMLLVLMSNILLPLIILSAARDSYERPSVFFGMMLIMQGAMNGVFVAMDMFLYYIFWEMALIPAYFLVLWWGSGDTKKITFKFFIYTLFGSLFMLVGIIWLSLQGTSPSTDISSIYALQVPADVQPYIFFALMLAFVIKIPVFPFHTWQPATYTGAPAPGTMLLSAIMLKMGLFSIIRWVIPVVPEAVETYDTLIIVLASVGVLYASAVAWVQKDIKTLFAWSSIAHVGLITAGIMTVSAGGLQGAMLQIFAHGVNAVGLFFVAQLLFRHFGHHQIDGMGGLRLSAPLFAGFFLVIMLASVALPLTNAFPGEFLLLNAIYDIHPWLTLLAGSGVILGAVYMFQAYRKTMLGEASGRSVSFQELRGVDLVVMIMIAGLIFVFGLFPQCITDLTEHSIQNLLLQADIKLNGTILK